MRVWVRRRIWGSLQQRLTLGAYSSARRLWAELRIQRQHRASSRRARALRDERHLRVQLGSGAKYKAGWVNVDLTPDADLQLDLRERLPFADGSVAMIYSEHFFEHIGYPDHAARLLGECLRVLEPGGDFSVGVPDAEEVLRQYARGELPGLMGRWSADESLRWIPAWVWRSPMHYVNFCFRQGDEHKYLYDFETLEQVLADAGFTGITRRQWDPALDSEERRDGTLYVDASRPA